MVRKAFHIILVVTLVLLTSGVTITHHFCGDSLRSVEIMTVPSSCCDMEGCCHNEIETLFLEDDFIIASISLLPQQTVFNLLMDFTESSDQVAETASGFIKTELKSYFRPPPPGGAEKRASLQVFIL